MNGDDVVNCDSGWWLFGVFPPRRRSFGKGATTDRVALILKVTNMLSVVMAWAAHLLAWAAGAWLAFAPFYQGVSYSGEGATESSSTLNPEEWTHYSETLIEANGLRVALYLIIPLLLTGIVVLAVHRVNIGNVWRTVLIWVTVAALFGFGVLTIFSIGIFYLPAVLALLIAAVTGTVAMRIARR